MFFLILQLKGCVLQTGYRIIGIFYNMLLQLYAPAKIKRHSTKKNQNFMYMSQEVTKWAEEVQEKSKLLALTEDPKTTKTNSQVQDKWPKAASKGA